MRNFASNVFGFSHVAAVRSSPNAWGGYIRVRNGLRSGARDLLAMHCKLGDFARQRTNGKMQAEQGLRRRALRLTNEISFHPESPTPSLSWLLRCFKRADLFKQREIHLTTFVSNVSGFTRRCGAAAGLRTPGAFTYRSGMVLAGATVKYAHCDLGRRLTNGGLQ